MTSDIKVRLSDRQHEMVVDAADEHGSKSEAVRHALEQVYGGDDPDAPRRNAHLPRELQESHQRLWEETGEHPILRISRSITILSQHLGVNAETVKRDYLKQLQRANMITTIDGMKLIVKDPIPAEPELTNLSDMSDDPQTDEEINDRLDQLDDADPVRADGGDKPDDNDGDTKQ